MSRAWWCREVVEGLGLCPGARLRSEGEELFRVLELGVQNDGSRLPQLRLAPRVGELRREAPERGLGVTLLGVGKAHRLRKERAARVPAEGEHLPPLDALQMHLPRALQQTHAVNEEQRL